MTQWDGSDEAEGEIEPTPENDILSLVNQDRPKGTVVAIEDESIEFLLRKERAIRVPVKRVKQIQFNSGKDIPSPPRRTEHHSGTFCRRGKPFLRFNLTGSGSASWPELHLRPHVFPQRFHSPN